MVHMLALNFERQKYCLFTIIHVSNGFLNPYEVPQTRQNSLFKQEIYFSCMSPR